MDDSNFIDISIPSQSSFSIQFLVHTKCLHGMSTYDSIIECFDPNTYAM